MVPVVYGGKNLWRVQFILLLVNQYDDDSAAAAAAAAAADDDDDDDTSSFKPGLKDCMIDRWW